MCKFANIELREMWHELIDTDLDLRLRINKELTTNNVNNNTFA